MLRQYWNKYHYLGLYLAFILGLCIRLFIAIQPADVLLQKNLPDDAYYYFSIARNTTETGSVSIDGIHTTNGFHPLWWLFLLPIFHFDYHSIDTPIHIAISLSALLDSLVIPLIWLIAYRLTKNKEISFFAALCYAINPVAIFQGTNGLETGLTQFCLVLFWYLLVLWMDEPKSNKLAILTGIAGGLMLLARNDTIFFFITGISAWLLLIGIKKGRKSAIGVAAIAIAMNIPWYLFSRLLLNSWVQDSGLAVPFAIQQRWVEEYGAAIFPRFIESIRQVLFSTFWLRGDPTGLPFFIGIGLWVLVLIILIRNWFSDRDTRSMAIILPPIVAGALLMLFHGGLRWYPRPWYFIILSAAWPIAAARALTVINQPTRILRIAYSSVFIYFILAGLIFWQAGFYPWQVDFLNTSHWINENTSEGTRIGSFNAGIYSYYSGRVIINLDGVVNHEAFLAIQQKSILPMLREKGVTYLIDSDMSIKQEYSPFLGGNITQELEEVIVIGEENGWAIGPIRVYKIRPD